MNEPACLIAAALHNAGVGLTLLRKHEGENAADFLRLFGLSDPLVRAAAEAQTAQDFGDSWGYVLDEFTRRLAKNRSIRWRERPTLDAPDRDATALLAAPEDDATG
ncbi:hypothetical protein BJF78_30135 [Pseudonocardia sp. CNS-139]|nr:hypothetical protein BJF78_30135 [Pseudonocardia sp. CNS-139]